MWIATIVPRQNVIAARTPLSQRLTKEELAAGAILPQYPYRVKGQRVKASTSRDALLAWIDKEATEADQVTLRRWKPGKGRKRRWRGGTKFG